MHQAGAYRGFPPPQHSLRPRQLSTAPKSVPISPVPARAEQTIRFAPRGALQETPQVPLFESRRLAGALPDPESAGASATADFAPAAGDSECERILPTQAAPHVLRDSSSACASKSDPASATG